MSGLIGQFRYVALADIKVADRLRPVDEDWAQALAGSIARDGLLSPIDICAEGKGYRLVAGAHRLRAHALLGLTEIAAFMRDHEALGRRAREIAENVMRRELDPIDRAAHITELYEVELQRAGVSLGEHRSKVGGLANSARFKAEAEEAGDKLSSALNLQAQVAEKVGLNVRTLQRDIALHRGLKPAVREALRGHKVAQAASQLLTLAKRPEAEQLQAAAAIVEGTASNAAFALRVIAGGREPPKHERKSNTIIATFSGLDARWKGETLRALAKMKLPAGFKITVPGGRGMITSSAADAARIAYLAGQAYGLAAIARAQGLTTVTVSVELAEALSRAACAAAGVDLVDAGRDDEAQLSMVGIY